MEAGAEKSSIIGGGPMPTFVALAMLLVLLFLFRLWNDKRDRWTETDDFVVLQRFAVVAVVVAVFVLLRQ